MYFVTQQNKTTLDHIITGYVINRCVYGRNYMTGLLVVQKIAYGE